MPGGKVSIIVPMFNEEKRIGNLLPGLIKFCRQSIRSYEIILVDDGSVDGTVAKARSLAKGGNARIVLNGVNRGKGAAVKAGFKAAGGDKMIFMDADGSIKPGEVARMLPLLDKNDIVYGTRISEGARITRPQPASRVIAGKTFNMLVNLMFGINVYDTLCGFKGFRRKAAKQLTEKLESDRFEFDVEMFVHARRLGCSMAELPITWMDVKGSKLNIMRDPLRMLVSLLKLKLRLLR